MARPNTASTLRHGQPVTARPQAPHQKRPRVVIGLGASAGGLESLGTLLAGLPKGFPAPILAVLHLDPHHRSHAVALLQARTRLAVRTAKQGVRPRAGTVYVAPPDRHLELRDGKLALGRGARVNYSRPSVDLLFASLAAERGAAAVVAVLSGAGSDGTQGVLAVKAQGGLAVAEDPSSAAFHGMPEAAMRTGLLDAVLPVRQLPAFLLRAVARGVAVSQRQWGRMLELLEERTGTRFAKYRSSTLHRRLHQRMTARDCRTMAAYLRVLEADPAEVDRLQAAFLIKVSSFSRDPAAWRGLERALGPLLTRRDAPVRAWSAGCATGEEAYTLAILLARLLGTGADAHWKVFGTDLDDGALRIARAGRYSADAMRGVAKADLRDHFVREGPLWRVGKALRARVVFGRHDLLNDPPLSRLGILACRNVLIYFTPREKHRAVQRLAAAVVPGGLLFLGRSEALTEVPGFTRVGLTTFFRKGGLEGRMPKKAPHDVDATPSPRRNGGHRPKGDARYRHQQDLNEELQSRNEELETVNEELQSLNDEMSTMEEQMRGLAQESRLANDFLRLLLDTSPDVLLACDEGNRVTFWNKAAIKRFRLSSAQAVGGELFDLVPALSTPALRAAVRRARSKGPSRRITVKEKGTEYHLDPLPGAGGKRRGYLLRVRTRRT